MNAIENPTTDKMVTQVKDPFGELFHVDVNAHTETKNNLRYLSWPFAWSEVRKRYPDANYIIVRNDDNMSYWRDPITGFLEVRTIVTIGKEAHEMWLPVMDSSNAPMKFEPYEVATRTGKRTIQGATMFDINKSLMRCLAKNLAMFGLGLYIYSGEDMPEEIVDENDPAVKAKKLVAEITAKARELKSMPDLSFDAVKKIISDTLGTNKPSECTDPEKLQEVLDKLNNIE